MTWIGDELRRIADDMPERDLAGRALETHHRRRRNLVAAVAAAVVVITVLTGTVAIRLLPGRVPDAARPPAPPERATVNVAMVSSGEAAPLFVAQEKGFFAAEGLTVQPVFIPSSAAAVPGLLEGQYALAQTDHLTAFVAHEHGRDVRIAGGLHRAEPRSLALAVEAGSQIRTVAGLKGKLIAVPELNGLAMLSLNAVLKRAGLAITQVKLVEKPYPEMLPGLRTGKFAAAVLAEPFVSMGQGHTRVLREMMTGEFAGLPTAGWMVEESWARANPRTMAAFLRALAKAHRVIADDPKAASAIIPSYLRTTTRETERAALGTYSAELDIPALQRLADVARRYGFLKKPLDVRSVIVPPR
ncbi:ABC transporter substrate-binding protein [Nonomuraea sp. NPDC050783]|uniref:ABC transporter substrate-binding protein n=1 Tax=Nonomuraea sp. NPDC050783 TaxID=3154634 RepID=UPI003465904F